MTKIIPHCIILLSALIFFIFIYPTIHIFPYSDEWEYVLAQPKNTGLDILSWVIAQHGDHVIPVQKIFQGLILKITGFDFRVLIAANFIVACIVALLAISIARLYRGCASIGDVFIPLCVLNFGAGITQWGFEFQFLSSVFFLVLFIFLAILSEKLNKPLFLIVSFLSLFICTFCGISGLVVSSTLSGVFSIYFLRECFSSKKRRPLSLYLVVVMVVLTNFYLWLNWSPSAASSLGPSFIPTIEFFFGLFNSSLVVYAFKNIEIKTLLLFFLFFVGILCVNRPNTIENNLGSVSKLALIGSLASTILLMFGLACSRSTYQEGWSPGLEMHYGFLTILVPITSWVVVSSKTRFSAPLGLMLVVLYSGAFFDNAEWRFIYLTRTPNLNNEIQLLIADEMIDSGFISGKYIKQFYFIDNPKVRSDVARGIDLLRKQGGFNYKRFQIEK